MSLLQRVKNKLFVELNPRFRERFIAPRYRKAGQEMPQDVTILSSNCLGGVICHELGLRFLSPTINLWMTPSDFIKYCANLRHYSACKLQFVGGKFSYPIGILGDITIYFQHYATEFEAQAKWEERTNRINYNNIHCILTERDGCTDEDLVAFAQLPYSTAALVHTPKPHIPNTHYIRDFEKEAELGNLMLYKQGQYFGRKYFDDFDFISFLRR